MRNGYKKWISKIDPCVHTKPSSFDCDLASVSVLDVEALRIVILDRVQHFLWEAFHWRTTQQGHTYWQNRASEYTPLSDEDMDYLHSLYNYWRDRDSNS